MIKGEYIDTSLRAITDPEDSAAWSAWEQRHASGLRTLDAAGLSGSWANVVHHAFVVNATAVFIGQKLVQGGEASLDLELIDTASLLEDAAKKLDKDNGISFADEQHASQLRGFLYSSGYSPEVIEAASYTGRVPQIHETADEQIAAIATLPLEHLVVGYADARVSNTDIVSLEKARDNNKKKVPADTKIYDKWYSFYKMVEGRLIGIVNNGDPDFTPQSINEDSVNAMVRAAADLEDNS